MKKNKITKRLSLKAKFMGNDSVQVVIMDDRNNVQIEVIPINFGDSNDTPAEPVENPDLVESTETKDVEGQNDVADEEDKQ